MMIDVDLIFAITKALINPSLNDLVKKLASKSVESFYKASLTGDGAIAQGDGAVASGQGGIMIGGDVQESTIITGNHNVIGNDNVVAGRDVVSGDKISIEKPSDKDTRTEKTFQKIAETSRFVTKQLELSYSQAREQAYTWFRFSIIAAVVGLLLITGGVITLLLGQTTEGIITTVSSIVPNVIAALFFVQSKASNERIDAIQSKLTESREIQTAVEIAGSIETKKERDKLKAEIVRRVIGLSAAES